MEGAHVNIGQHWKGNLDLHPLLHVHLDTVVTTWVAMGIVIILALYVTRDLNRIPGKIQLIAEMLMKFLDDISVSQMGKEGLKHSWLIASLFLFILAGNLLGQIPMKMIKLSNGEFASPTNDLNTTLGLALLVLVYYFGAGIAKKGIGYFKHYFQPFWFMAPFNILEDFTRPLSLSVRLFGNILAGEVIIGILIVFMMIFSHQIGNWGLKILAIGFTDGLIIVFVLFELFVALIQAFIFAVLSASYVATATSESH